MYLKKYSICLFLLVVLLPSCKKEPTDKISLDSVCQGAISPNQGLIGKWQLNRWKMSYYNNLFCEAIGWNEYSAETNDIDVVMEITANGAINFYFDDTLRSSYLLTGSVDYGNPDFLNCYYNCGTDKFVFRKFIPNFENLIIGDSISFSGPDFNINYVDGILKAITTDQVYIKIE